MSFVVSTLLAQLLQVLSKYVFISDNCIISYTLRSHRIYLIFSKRKKKEKTTKIVARDIYSFCFVTSRKPHFALTRVSVLLHVIVEMLTNISHSCDLFELILVGLLVQIMTTISRNLTIDVRYQIARNADYMKCN